jgi:hypothetical protein
MAPNHLSNFEARLISSSRICTNFAAVFLMSRPIMQVTITSQLQQCCPLSI